MHKAMAFIDYQNFNINLITHYGGKEGLKNINYVSLSKVINERIPLNSELMKTYLFAYKPSDTLMQLDQYSRYYNWLTTIKNTPYMEVIEGRQEIRPVKGRTFDINDTTSFTTAEKETDINMAVHMVAKAFQNAYDIAVLISGDTDYVPVVEMLHSIGKTVVIAPFPHQDISRYNGICDDHVILHDNILDLAVTRR